MYFLGAILYLMMGKGNGVTNAEKNGVWDLYYRVILQLKFTNITLE